MNYTRLIFSLLLATFACLSFAEEPETTSAHVEASIPATLDDALLALDMILSEEQKEAIRSSSKGAVAYHFSLGMGLRNRWGLWKGSVLAKYFNDLGVMDPDAMSAMILDTYIRKLRGQPIDIEEQIARHKADWEASRPMRELMEKRMKEARRNEE